MNCDQAFEMAEMATAEPSHTSNEATSDCGLLELDDWQVEEDLREARQVVGSHFGSQLGSHRQISVGLTRISDSLRTGVGNPSKTESPLTKQFGTTGADTIQPPMALPISAARSPQPRTKTNRTAWTGLAFAAAGLVGGLAAMTVAQSWPEHFLTVLFLELGLGVMFAMLLGRRHSALLGSAQPSP